MRRKIIIISLGLCCDILIRFILYKKCSMFYFSQRKKIEIANSLRANTSKNIRGHCIIIANNTNSAFHLCNRIQILRTESSSFIKYSKKYPDLYNIQMKRYHRIVQNCCHNCCFFCIDLLPINLQSLCNVIKSVQSIQNSIVVNDPFNGPSSKEKTSKKCVHADSNFTTDLSSRLLCSTVDFGFSQQAAYVFRFIGKILAKIEF